MNERVDPHVTAVGFDVTKLSAEELRSRGVLITTKVMGDGGEAWMSHARYAEVNPGHDEKLRSGARLAAYLHFERGYLEVACPTCGRGRGRPCARERPANGEGISENRAAPGYSHKSRRELAAKEGCVTLKGLRLQQTFPCAGMLRTIERIGKVRIVQCDVCGLELGVAPPKPGDEPEDQRPLGEDDIPL